MIPSEPPLAPKELSSLSGEVKGVASHMKVAESFFFFFLQSSVSSQYPKLNEIACSASSILKLYLFLLVCIPKCFDNTNDKVKMLALDDIPVPLLMHHWT